jgi:hypothetical protein
MLSAPQLIIIRDERIEVKRGRNENEFIEVKEVKEKTTSEI